MQETKQTIGQRLRSVRLARQISLEKASEATRVRPHYLQALEEDNYSVMISAAQGRGFLRLYADFLGLDLDAAMEDLRHAEAADATPAPPAPELVTSPSAPVPVQETNPPASSEGTAVRRPFWARLLRRSVPEPSTKEEAATDVEAIPETASHVGEISVPAAEPVEVAPESVIEPKTVRTTARAKKTASSKNKASVKTVKVAKPKSKPKVSAKATAKVADKKKVSLKSKAKKNRR